MRYSRKPALDKGILLVAFGTSMLDLALAAFGKKSILEGLPVHLITDNRARRELPSGWTCQEFSHLGPGDSRWVRTRAPSYTPFVRTLMLDVDQVVQKRGIRKFFDIPGDFVATPVLRWEPGELIYRIYADAFYQLGGGLPITLYGGALQLFNNCTSVRRLFSAWHNNWVQLGSGRDMPALNVAIQKWGGHLGEVPLGWHASSMRRDKDAIIQHSWGDEAFRLAFGLPRFSPNKKFDRGREVTDWQGVPFGGVFTPQRKVVSSGEYYDNQRRR
jgi:hypothetical protein